MTPVDAPSPSRQRRTGWARGRAGFKIIVPIVITLGLLAYVSTIAVAPKSGGQIWAIVRHTWWIVLLLTIPYIAARAILWHELLEQLGIHVPWRPTLVALAGGEIGKTVPGGIYLQNYILTRLVGFDELAIVRSSIATTASLGLESAIALPVALIIGIPHTPWLSWALLGIIAAWLLLLILLRILVHYRDVHLSPRRPRWYRRGIHIAEEAFEAVGELLTWRTVRALLPTATYMLVTVANLYLITAAIGIHTVNFFHTMGIYSIVVLTAILVPTPTKIGTTELTGLAGFVAFGIPHPTAAVIMLGLRLLGTGMTILMAALLMLILRREFRVPQPASPTDGP